MKTVTAETAPMIAAAAVRGDAMLFLTDPEGTRYSFALVPDIFAAPLVPLGGGEPRQTFAMRRTDGQEMLGSWSSSRAKVERDIYGATDLALQLAGTIAAGGTVEAAPYYGPHRFTLRDQIDAWEQNASRFKAEYRAAWKVRDWAAAAAAAKRFKAGLPVWYPGDRNDGMHDSAATIARNMRGEPHPPRFHIGTRYHHGNRRKGFASYVATERAILEGLDSLRGLPGYAADDVRPVVPVVLRWTGKVHHVARAELNMVAGRFLHPVKPDGSPMPRTASFERAQVESIRPARKAAA